VSTAVPPPTRTAASWTALGYTYDWAHGERGIGASEFLLAPGPAYDVEDVQTPASYRAGS